MPELPEVETVYQGLKPHVTAQKITSVTVRESRLRWSLPPNFAQLLEQQTIKKIQRRGKYLLIYCSQSSLIIHLGMSGSLRLVKDNDIIQKHDHVDIVLNNNLILRFNDPRRFGCMILSSKDPLQHNLLKHLGPEPLTDEFTAAYLFQQSRQKKVAIKTFIMNSKIVVGVGNIYANEALYQAKLLPTKAAGKITKESYTLLVKQIKKVLAHAIKVGGTTIRNFSNATGKPGYFKQQLNVYGRGNLPCKNCKTLLKEIRMNQRTTVYCPSCQI